LDQAGPEVDPAAGGGGRSRFNRAVRAIALDVSILRDYPDYRRLWSGITVSQLGSQMTLVAVPVQVYALTKSSLAVGMLGLVGLVPLIVFGLYGGALADALDRRKLAMLTSTGLLITSAVLFLQAITDLGQLWLIYLLVAIQSALFAIDNPTRSAIIPRLVARERLPAANALSQLTFNLALTVGPLIAGLVIAFAGLETAYAVDAVSFLAALYVLSRLPTLVPEGDVRRAGFRSVVEGLRYVSTRSVLMVSFLADIAAMVLVMPKALYPEMAEEIFGGGPDVVGLMFSALGVGGALAAALGGWMGRIHRHGVAVLIAVAAWAVSIIGFGLSPVLWLALAFLALAGAADLVSAVFRSSILQSAAPDEMRGRLFGLNIVVVTGGPRLADVRAGAVAVLFSPIAAVVSGGITCLIALALLALRFPAFVRYDARQLPPALAGPQ
jgi:MFS family permease